MNDVEKILKKKRIALGLTQDDVAVQANITRLYYSQIESGNKRPSPDVAKKIAAIYQIDKLPPSVFGRNTVTTLRSKSY